MKKYKLPAKLMIFGIFITLLLGFPITVYAVPAFFTWGSFDAGGSTAYGVYEHNNIDPLLTGALAQLLWVGPDGLINTPLQNGSAGGDDVILDTATVLNGLPLPPAQWDRGYIPLETYTYDTGDPQNGNTVYIRAWNASTPANATAYGNSTTSSLTSGGTFNAPRWIMTNTPTAITLSTFHATSTGNSSLIRISLTILVGIIGLYVLYVLIFRRVRNHI